MSKKVTIIGAGSVGATIAYTLAVTGTATEVVMIDINEPKSLGEALDIRQGVAFCSPMSIYAGSYEDARDSDIVILTSGIARKPGQTRLELAQINVDITKSIASQIVKYAPNAVYIIVSNPVDILTYLFHQVSGLPEHQIIGSGTILDTARLRARLAEYFSISQQNVHAHVFGEHGDSSFVPWSLANISNIPIDEYAAHLTSSKKEFFPPLIHSEVEDYIRKSGGKIIERKGATFYAVSISVCHICKCIFAGVDTTLSVSTPMHGEYGIEGVCLSTLANVGRGGVTGRLTPPLTDGEIALLRKSADSLKAVISNLSI